MHLLISFIISLALYENPILEGRWIIERFISFENVMQSKNFQNMDIEHQERALRMYDLYMHNVDLNFKSDTVYFKDLKNEEIINKVGLWFIDNDTLIINDLEVIAAYKYYIESFSDCEMHLKPILRGGIKGKSGSVYINENCK